MCTCTYVLDAYCDLVDSTNIVTHTSKHTHIYIHTHTHANDSRCLFLLSTCFVGHFEDNLNV